MHNMHLSREKALVVKNKISRPIIKISIAKVIIKITFILTIVVDIKVDKININFLLFKLKILK